MSSLVVLCLPMLALAEKGAKRNVQQETVIFQENKGQVTGFDGSVSSYVLFKAETPGLNVWVTTTGLTYQFFTIDKVPLTNVDGSFKLKGNGEQEKEKKIRWQRVDMVLKGASIRKENISAAQEVTQGNVRYFLGHCPDGIFNVKSYQKITVKGVYPNIDWVIYSAGGKLKYDFVVHPGADPKAIVLVYEGSGNIHIESNRLQFRNELGELREGDLFCYQDNSRNEVKSSYRVQKKEQLQFLGAGNTSPKPKSINNLAGRSPLFSYEVGVTLEKYDETKDLIIDPELAWGTLCGGNMDDGFMSMDTDSAGNLFIGGYFISDNFPTQTAGTFYQGVNNGVNDAFLMRFDGTGALNWATYYGGEGFDFANAITLDGSGNLFVTGQTSSSDFPIQPGGTFYQPSKGGGFDDAFVLKFDNAGNRLWATYYGGDDNEIGNAITTDNNGNVFVTGYTGSSDFPKENAGTFFQGNNAGGNDAFILKFDNLGTLLWSSYYGGNEWDEGKAITTDNVGNVFVTGRTNSTNFIDMDAGGYYDDSHNGDRDAFISKFDNAGSILWSTYYGGEGWDIGHSILTDGMDNLWVTGITRSTNFPVQNAGTFFQGTAGGFTDAFILKFDKAGNRLFATYYGGALSENHNTNDNLAVDDCNSVYVSFTTTSTDNVVLDAGNNHYYDDTHGGNDDAFISKFSSAGDLLWASYIGSDNKDFRAPLAVDNANNLFLAGEFVEYENTSTLPMMNADGAYFDDLPNGEDDSYILKFIPPSLENAISTQSNMSSCTVCNGEAMVDVRDILCGDSLYTYKWSNGIQMVDTPSTTASIAGLCSGDYNVEVSTTNGDQTEIFNFTIAGGPCSSQVEIYLPNVFTPNENDLNDTFFPVGVGMTDVDYSFQVYNRWGERVFQSILSGEGWDGTYKGKEAAQDLYTWKLELQDVNGDLQKRVGKVGLVR